MQSTRRNLIISVLSVVFGGPGILLLYLPLWITHFRIPAGEPLWQKFCAVALIIAGLLPALESVRRFIYIGRGTLLPVAPPEHLVVSGFYRYVRNPMYVGVLVALAGEFILFRNRGIAIETTLTWLGASIFILLYEEPSLTRQYGEEYLGYKQHVPRWLPRLTPWRQPQN